MLLDEDTCYQAILSRDARFDGRLFTGVLTTGIYCRPVCPARTPFRKNVKFYSCAAAAEEAGFRPCQRCRPETAPGSLAWMGTSATVSRGMKLIADGALDTGSVDELALRLGVGSRHLRRLFIEHVGATPIAVAQTRRLHFARKLLDETDLPIAQIVHAAGFNSVRRFNAAIKQTFRRSPTEVRRLRKNGSRSTSSEAFRLRLPYRVPFDYFSLLGFFATRALSGVESITGNTYRRTIQIEGQQGIIEISPAVSGNALELTVYSIEPRHLIKVVERVRRMFDLQADPFEIEQHLRNDVLLRATLQQNPGIRVPGAWDEFELAVRAILGQQVSVAGARTVAGRIVERFGEPISDGDDSALRYLFPLPSALAQAKLEQLGIVRARAQAIRALATTVASGELDLSAGTDWETTTQQLLSLRGVGPWTAEYIGMRALRNPDAFPASDLGLRQGASTNGELISAKSLEQRAARWRPWRAYAALCLWKRNSDRAGRSVRQRRMAVASH